jgi:hypothetical protein
MAFDDAVSPAPVPTSRRAVLRTGVKLAYAAPVVAASMKLAEQATGAQVSGPAPTATTPSCVPPGQICLTDQECCALLRCIGGQCV